MGCRALMAVRVAFPESDTTNVSIPSWRGIMTVCRQPLLTAHALGQSPSMTKGDSIDQAVCSRNGRDGDVWCSVGSEQCG